jgi:hypothetical protein
MARAFVRALAPSSSDAFIGDLTEEANQRIDDGRSRYRVRLWILLQVVRSAPRLAMMPLLARGHFSMSRWIAIAVSAGSGLVPFWIPGVRSVIEGYARSFSSGEALFLVAMAFGARTLIGWTCCITAWFLCTPAAVEVMWRVSPVYGRIPIGPALLAWAALAWIERRKRFTRTC